MTFELFLDLKGLDYYGSIPEIPNEPNGRVEIYQMNGSEDVKLFMKDVDEIDSICDALLDNGDVDYFDFHKCEKLIAWIDERLQEPAVPRYREILEVLKKYCQRAIELNTGVVIEL